VARAVVRRCEFQGTSQGFFKDSPCFPQLRPVHALDHSAVRLAINWAGKATILHVCGRPQIARVRRFRVVLRDGSLLRDWMVERTGFEQPAPMVRTRCCPARGISGHQTEIIFDVYVAAI
jgi:hypothetical protein